MDEYEREFLTRTVDNLATTMALGLRDGMSDERAIEDGERLAPAGRMWVQGYLTSRLATIRCDVMGNPNLSTEDVEQIADLVEREQRQIAAGVYS